MPSVRQWPVAPKLSRSRKKGPSATTPMNRSAITEMSAEQRHSFDDEERLYAILDRALSELEEGRDIDVDSLLVGCEHLRDRVLDMVRLATRTSIGASRSLPRVPGYTLLKELGQGGMGSVYLARQERIGGRPVALKVLPHGSGLSHRARRRFSGEALAIGKLRHPNIVAIFDVIEDGESPAYAMEWVDGPTLADMIRAARSEFIPNAARRGDPFKNVLDVAQVCRLGVAIARALAAIHKTGIVHRDIKPSNILIRPDGVPLVSDFGLAREADSTITTQAGQFAGTVAYAAPEQLRGDQDSVDARSDIYSLGVTLFHALALRLPYEATEAGAMLREIERGPSVTLRRKQTRMPRDLETIVTKAMDPDPRLRYPTADDLADDLERVLTFQPIKARRASAWSRLTKSIRRHRGATWGLIAGSILSLTLGAMAVSYVFLMPGWVARHVAEARLCLLDPWVSANIFSSEIWKQYDPLVFDSTKLQKPLAHYEAALRWSPFDEQIKREHEVVLWASHGAANEAVAGSKADPRCEGLRAFLTGDVDRALYEWTRYEVQRDMASADDPLVEGAMGMLYLSRNQPQRAYPRLTDAVQAFPNVGFLHVHLADAATQCGDFEQARLLLDRAATMPRPDSHGGLERVRADLLAAQNLDAEAENSYKEIVDFNPVARMHLGQLLERNGRLLDATRAYQRVCAKAPTGPLPARALLSAADRWWASLRPEERLSTVHDALNQSPFENGSFVQMLVCYRQCRVTLSTENKGGENIPTGDEPWADDIGLDDLTQRLEVADRSLWDQIPLWPDLLKEVQFAAWRRPTFRALANWARDAYCALHRLEAATRGKVPSCPEKLAPPQGLVSWWPGDGNANDIWGGHDGILLNGTGFAEGMVGQAFCMNGPIQCGSIRVPDAEALKLQQFTINAWVRSRHEFHRFPSGYYVAALSDLTATTGFDIGLSPRSERMLQTNITRTRDSEHGSLSAIGTTSLADNRWHHVAVALGSEWLKMWIDGEVQAESAVPSGSAVSYAADAVFIIGRSANSPLMSSTLPGLIDELQVFDRALSDAEIRSIFEAGSAGQCKSFK